MGLFDKIFSYSQKKVIRDVEFEKEAYANLPQGNLWDDRWLTIGSLTSPDLKKITKSFGLYRTRMYGKIAYIGLVADIDTNLFAVISNLNSENLDQNVQFTEAENLIVQHAEDIDVDILLTGNDEKASKIAKLLHEYFVEKLEPEWNFINQDSFAN